jgi:hypothetical protein
MGQNLSSKIVVDTSPDVISPQDGFNTKQMFLLWAASFYAVAMIWSTTALVDRWRGPQGNRGVSFASVIAAIILSTAWPVVFLYLIMSG